VNKNLRPYSILLPDGKCSTSHRSLLGALVTARTCNVSREARGLPFVRVMGRETGRTWDVPPDADCLAMADGER